MALQLPRHCDITTKRKIVWANRYLNIQMKKSFAMVVISFKWFILLPCLRVSRGGCTHNLNIKKPIAWQRRWICVVIRYADTMLHWSGQQIYKWAKCEEKNLTRFAVEKRINWNTLLLAEFARKDTNNV